MQRKLIPRHYLVQLVQQLLLLRGGLGDGGQRLDLGRHQLQVVLLFRAQRGREHHGRGGSAHHRAHKLVLEGGGRRGGLGGVGERGPLLLEGGGLGRRPGRSLQLDLNMSLLRLRLLGL